MQREMARVQEEMEAKTVTGTAGGGAVTVTVNGKLELLSVEIEPEVVDPDDVEMLQDLVMAATNEAIREVTGHGWRRPWPALPEASRFPVFKGH